MCVRENMAPCLSCMRAFKQEGLKDWQVPLDQDLLEDLLEGLVATEVQGFAAVEPLLMMKTRTAGQA